MRIAVVGSREYPRMDVMRERVTDILTKEDTLVSGGARGVDSAAALIAHFVGCKTIIHRPDWSKGRGAGFARNQKIVDDADAVAAFWDGRSRGTADTIRKARLAKKRVVVFGPDGQRIPDAELRERLR